MRFYEALKVFGFYFTPESERFVTYILDCAQDIGMGYRSCYHRIRELPPDRELHPETTHMLVCFGETFSPEHLSFRKNHVVELSGISFRIYACGGNRLPLIPSIEENVELGFPDVYALNLSTRKITHKLFDKYSYPFPFQLTPEAL